MKSFILATLLGLTSLFATVYQVDTEKSLVTFKIHHAVVAKVEGKFNDFLGTYEYNDEFKYFSSFKGKAKIDSIDTDEPHRDKHLKEKLFESSLYPTMNLELISQDGSDFKANLTIKGITKAVDFQIGISPSNEKQFLLVGKNRKKRF
jgi:polyisoprenoid-binding protein YceI